MGLQKRYTDSDVTQLKESGEQIEAVAATLTECSWRQGVAVGGALVEGVQLISPSIMSEPWGSGSLALSSMFVLTSLLLLLLLCCRQWRLLGCHRH